MDEILDDIFINRKIGYRFTTLPMIIWGSIFIVGILFKVQHWPGNSIIRVIGASGFIAYSVSGFIRLRGKDTLNIISFILSAIWIIYLVVGLLFNGGYPLNLIGLITHFGLMAAIFFIYEALERRKAKSYKQNKS